MIAARTGVRADLFTTLLSAAYLALLWRYHRTGKTRLWLLPVLMILWVDTHLGFIVGLGLIGGYVLVEGLECFCRNGDKRQPSDCGEQGLGSS